MVTLTGGLVVPDREAVTLVVPSFIPVIRF